MIALLMPWLASGKRIAAVGAAAALVALLALWRLEAAHVRQLESQLQSAQAAQKGAEGQAAASGAATAVIAAGAQRDQRALTLHAENSHDIEAASGAGQSLDLDLNAAGRRGLCAYPDYQSDPGCVQLRGADPGQRPPAGGADAAAGR